MNNIFKITENIKNNEYDYNSKIYNPSQLGMSDKGDLKTLTNNIGGIIGYTDLLMFGNSNASTTRQPLGNSYFLNTGAKCKDSASGKIVDRSVYIDNVPSGIIKMPNYNSNLGSNNVKTSFKGLIPGLTESIIKLNPVSLLSSITNNDDNCSEVYMKTIKQTSPTSQKKQITNAYVLDNEIKDLDACLFNNSINPITKQGCVEAFTNYNNNIKLISYKYTKSKKSKLYLMSISLLYLYLFFKIMKK